MGTNNREKRLPPSLARRWRADYGGQGRLTVKSTLRRAQGKRSKSQIVLKQGGKKRLNFNSSCIIIPLCTVADPLHGGPDAA